MNTSISVDDHRIRFGLYPKARYESANVAVYTRRGELIETLHYGELQDGEIHFTWGVRPGRRAEYFVRVDLDEGTYLWIYPFQLDG